MSSPWQVNSIAVVGPGIVGMPMAAMLAHARILIGTDTPATVTVIQRASPTSGWKVDAINQGRSPIGGIEPDLARIVAESVRDGLLSATHDYAAVRDADVILVAVQTDRRGNEPDYGPLMEALEGVAGGLRGRTRETIPLLVIESTLAPSSMATVIRDHFARHGLVEGRDILLGNSPNRVMPGRLVERVANSDKVVAGLDPRTPSRIADLYSHIVTGARLLSTGSLAAEIVKTLENAYRDVRIAFSAEVARWCDRQDVDFHALREVVNDRLDQADPASRDPNAVPSGGLLIPTVGVGGHCLPKDGILLWWRMLEAGMDTSRSLILGARTINDESPRETLTLAERRFGPLEGRRVALLGTAYRFNSEDTRNSPTLALALLLRERGIEFRLHDPYVQPSDQNLARYGLSREFTRDTHEATDGADLLVFCTAHATYRDDPAQWRAAGAAGVVDACNLFPGNELAGLEHTGIGRGQRPPDMGLVEFVEDSFHVMERGVANELQVLVDFLNERYAGTGFGRATLAEIQHLASTCPTGCWIANPSPVGAAPTYSGFTSRLVRRAAGH